jgi:hypothetical protein
MLKIYQEFSGFSSFQENRKFFRNFQELLVIFRKYRNFEKISGVLEIFRSLVN